MEDKNVSLLQGSPQHQPWSCWWGWGLFQTAFLGFLRVGKEENLLGGHGIRLEFFLDLIWGAEQTRARAGGLGFWGLTQRGGSCDTKDNSDRTCFSQSTDTESVLEPTWGEKNFEEHLSTK